jgi:hypothetical protein
MPTVYQRYRDRKLNCIYKTRSDRSVVVYLLLYARIFRMCSLTIWTNSAKALCTTEIRYYNRYHATTYALYDFWLYSSSG